MSHKNIQDILPLVEKPSRYIGSEINTSKKDLSRMKMKMALAFPDLYEIGTSHFGIQILYHMINQLPEAAAERVFAPAGDVATRLRKDGLPLTTLESGTPLGAFDIIGFSLLYELNYTNVLEMLDLAGIPFMADQRGDAEPLIIAGGPCTCNPEPVADLFDAMVIGDGEAVIIQMITVWMDWKKMGDGQKKTLLRLWSAIEGVYIPSFFEAQYDLSGFQRLKPRMADYACVKRAVVGDLNQTAFPDAPIIPFGRPVHDRLRLEVARGCTRGCRFCQAGMIYRPVRERSVPTLMHLAERSLAATGYEELSLLSLSTGDYSGIEALVQGLIDRCQRDHIAVSLPSLRAGTVTHELMEQIRKVRKTGFTIAPEAGSQRLRDVINKNISEKEIFDTVREAFGMGWQVIKLYFMVGLPTETDADLEAIVDLVERLRKMDGRGRRKAKINVSVTTLIPKPHTPFQWASQLSLEEALEKIQQLKSRLNLPGIHFKWQDPRVSLIEGLWSRGDRRLSRLLVNAYQKGCRFDGWSDQFNFRLWQAAIQETRTDIDFFTTRNRDIADPLPWDHIDNRVERKYLVKEWQKTKTGESTPDCRWGRCSQCGACDFKRIEPIVFAAEPGQKAVTLEKGIPAQRPKIFKKVCIGYSKVGPARFFGHLEMVNIIFRAVRRAGVEVKFSEGFHPLPRISFEDPLPIGTESLNEKMYLTVPATDKCAKIIDAVNRQLPEGLKFNRCEPVFKKKGKQKGVIVEYRVALQNGTFGKEALEGFRKTPSAVITRQNKKGKLKKIDLKDIVLKIDADPSGQLNIRLKNEAGKAARPIEIIDYIFGLPEEELKTMRVLKIESKEMPAT